MNLILPLFLGVLGSVIASVIFLLVLRNFRPKIEISEHIAKWEKDGTSGYSVKILNKGSRNIIDLRYEIFLVTKESIPGGELLTTRSLALKNYSGFILSKYERKSTEGSFARRIVILDDVDFLWDDDSSQYVIFRVFSHDEVSGLGKLYQREFRTKRNSIKDGQFHFGDSFEVS